MVEGAGEKLMVFGVWGLGLIILFVVYGLLFCLGFGVWCYVYHFSAISPERDVA